MAFARTDTIDQRVAILDGLRLRNRLVGVLRLAVPAAGVAAFAALAVQITIANMLNQYGVAGIRIDRGQLVVETPKYSGTGANGARYSVGAAEARAAIDNTNLIEMIDASLDFTRVGQPTMHGTAAAANFDSAAQILRVPGVTKLSGDDGMRGTLVGLNSNLTGGITLAEGPVDVTFASGMHLVAANMRREDATQTWTFEKATLTVPALPKSARPPIPDFAFHGWVTG